MSEKRTISVRGCSSFVCVSAGLSVVDAFFEKSDIRQLIVVYEIFPTKTNFRKMLSVASVSFVVENIYKRKAA